MGIGTCEDQKLPFPLDLARQLAHSSNHPRTALEAPVVAPETPVMFPLDGEHSVGRCGFAAGAEAAAW